MHSQRRPRPRTTPSRVVAGAALDAMRASGVRWLSDEGRTSLPEHLIECFGVMGVGLGVSGFRDAEER